MKSKHIGKQDRSVVRAFTFIAAMALMTAATSCGGNKNNDDDDQKADSGKGSATTMSRIGDDAHAATGSKDFGVTYAPQNVAMGKATYQTTCAPCHGAGGKGDGPAAAALNPKPRDHTNGAHMDTLTNEHIFKAIKEGGAQFGYPTMPAQPALAEDTVRNIIAFVRSLSPTFKH